ncbi:MAG: electron transport complex subunit RsxE [Anaerovoracaceae bacterium]|jgi:electron transport complex protein RnfE
MSDKSKFRILTNGILKENPNMVLVLGTCPTLATTSTVANGFGMGISAMAVLVCSNIVISMLRKIIPDKVRIPCYITVIAGFVTVVQFVLQAYMPALYSSLGLFLPLIVVNCIILGRAEMFANKNTVLDSALDGIGMGLGFTLSLCLMGAIRELCSQGTILGFRIIPESVPGMNIFSLAPGGFFVFALIMAWMHHVTRDKSKIRKEFGLGGIDDMQKAEEELKLEQKEAKEKEKEAA